MTIEASGCCTGFSRSEMLRRGVAEAGRGLPAIEPGMPLPAGTGLSRRSFLARSIGMSMAVYGMSALGPRAFEAGIAEAAGLTDSPVLVSVFLPGGVDSLSLLAPTEDPLYATARPTLASTPGFGSPFEEDARLRWHEQAAPFATLHSEGKLAVLPGIGYSGPNQSHFTSRHFWEVGSTDAHTRRGWLGRFLDLHGVEDNPLQGLSLSTGLSPVVAASTVPVAAVSQPESYSFRAPGVEDPVHAPMLEAFGRLGELPGGNTARDQARDAVAAAHRVRIQLATLQGVSPSDAGYPSGEFSSRLGAFAKMVAEGMPVRCAALTAPGAWDTHADQAAAFPQLLDTAARSLLAFQRDLETRGVADRVLTLVWSEFGRRVKQNGTGTDHGAAGTAMVMGTRVRGRMVGEFPGLDRVDSLGNLRATSDFRGLYCSLLEQWMGVDADPVIPGAASFDRYDLVA